MAQIKDHGGDLDRAQALYGAGDWLDLSTGINPVPYPLPEMVPAVWGPLPTKADIKALELTAAAAFGTKAPCAALAGAQGAIQLVPRLSTSVARDARIIAPTYNEHGHALRAQGWNVTEVATFDALAGADVAVVVNPNNPDGRSYAPDALLALAAEVGLLVVDESFCDPTPNLSLLPRLPQGGNVVVMRSFGKFYGLAGVRLGFLFGPEDKVAQARALAGPWAVSGPAIAAGRVALGDTAWQAVTIARLQADAARLDDLAGQAGWRLVGGTTLFRTYETGDAADAQAQLAKAHIWSRIFPYSNGWLRLGFPGDASGWARLEQALIG